VRAGHGSVEQLDPERGLSAVPGSGHRRRRCRVTALRVGLVEHRAERSIANAVAMHSRDAEVGGDVGNGPAPDVPQEHQQAIAVVESAQPASELGSFLEPRDDPGVERIVRPRRRATDEHQRPGPWAGFVSVASEGSDEVGSIREPGALLRQDFFPRNHDPSVSSRAFVSAESVERPLRSLGFDERTVTGLCPEPHVPARA